MDSTLYPIRVHYTISAGLHKAEEALGYAEASWQIQVEQMGFPEPSTEDATGTILPGLWIFLDPDGLYDHTEPIGDNPNTSVLGNTVVTCRLSVLIISAREVC